MAFGLNNWLIVFHKKTNENLWQTVFIHKLNFPQKYFQFAKLRDYIIVKCATFSCSIWTSLNFKLFLWYCKMFVKQMFQFCTLSSFFLLVCINICCISLQVLNPFKNYFIFLFSISFVYLFFAMAMSYNWHQATLKKLQVINFYSIFMFSKEFNFYR